MDQLSEVLDLVETRVLLGGGLAARGPWTARGTIEDPLKFCAMLSGRARLTTDDADGPIELEAGEVALLNNRSWVRMQGGTGEGPRQEIVPEQDVTRLVGADRDRDDVVLGGCIELNPAGRALLQQALPAVGHVRASAPAAANVRRSLDRLFDEVTENRIGSAFAVRRHGQLLILEVLRAYVGQTEPPPGWLRLLTDERLRPALSLMHAEPGRAWSLHELARAASMSRTSFAQRFRTVAGMPPLTYLNRWRMMLARRALRDGDTRLGPLASELGYASESAFSTAFKREVGESPLRYRSRTQEEQRTRATSLPA